MKRTENGKKKWRLAMAASIMTCLAVIVGIMLAYSDDIKKSKDNDEKKYNVISIGFSQVGAESGWRTGNSISMKNTFSSKKGYDLIFNDAQQQQEQQIKAIRSFIQQGVDYIVLAPVVETGWDTVLEEAEAAKIPVIVEDRRVEVKDDSLYTTWVGADFYTEGQKACNWLEQYADRKKRKSLNIVHIMGTEGATAQVGRTKALEEAAAKNGWTILEEANGEFTQAKGQEVMKRFLQQYKDIDVVYCDNDNEALGAVTAIKEAGKKLGPEGITVVSFDATKEGLQAVKNGEIGVDIECNPDFGEKIERVIKLLEHGEKVEKEYYISDKVFAKNTDIGEIAVGKSRWEVVAVTDQIIEGRVY